MIDYLALRPAQQRHLWETASASPASAAELLEGRAEAVFNGRNSLPLLSRFQKRFALVDGEVVGRNLHPLAPLIGPGYFTVLGAGAGPGLVFDYSRLPGRAPAGWPPVRPNTGGLAGLVYGKLQDDVRWVSGDVLVGSARRGGRPLGSYFVLVRV